MKGKTYKGAPPGYITIADVCQKLGMSRQHFHQSGLADALDHWHITHAATLYREDDVRRMRHWLRVRQGLIALGLRPTKYPLNPDKDEYYAAVEAGEWDQACPRCDADAVGPPEGPIWCPNCGVVEEAPIGDYQEETKVDVADLIRELDLQYYSAIEANPNWEPPSFFDYLVEQGITEDEIWRYSPQIGYDAGKPKPDWL
ncbi:MAG: hypothetical protein P8186_09290 [Anaerolineae bacterium]|jgi:hypothetical protein